MAKALDGKHVARVALLAAVVLVLGGVAARAEDGAAGSLREGMDSAAESTKKDLTHAGEAVGQALDTAISKTGAGVSHALEVTGNGIQSAGKALSGDSGASGATDAETPPAEAAPAPDAVPQHKIQEEPLDE